MSVSLTLSACLSHRFVCAPHKTNTYTHACVEPQTGVLCDINDQIVSSFETSEENTSVTRSTRCGVSTVNMRWFCVFVVKPCKCSTSLLCRRIECEMLRSWILTFWFDEYFSGSELKLSGFCSSTVNTWVYRRLLKKGWSVLRMSTTPPAVCVCLSALGMSFCVSVSARVPPGRWIWIWVKWARDSSLKSKDSHVWSWDSQSFTSTVLVFKQETWPTTTWEKLMSGQSMRICTWDTNTCWWWRGWWGRFSQTQFIITSASVQPSVLSHLMPISLSHTLSL